VSTIEALLSTLQSDAAVQEVLIGAFWTAVLLQGSPPRCGLASTMSGHPHHGGAPLPQAGRLQERSGRELAELLRSSSSLEASVGMGAFNALLDVDESICTEVNAREVILERGAGRRVAIVGHFPFVEQVRKAAGNCWVLELNPGPGDLPSERSGEILPQADVVALTGTSLINHTFDGLIDLCRPDAYVVLLGGSAPLSPVLLDRGVDVVAGTRVVDAAAAMGAIGQGATFRQIPGKRLLAMEKQAGDEFPVL
jgi:uncharacterized protein (DUF4213/DUF364 family)